MNSTYLEQFYSLLLLSSPPPKVSLESLKAAYGSGLLQALQKSSQASSKSTASILDIAVAHDDYSSEGGHHRLTFSRMQELLGLMYRLTCIICIEESIGVEYNNDVDVRLFTFEAGPGEDIQMQNQTVQSNTSLGNLQTLAATHRPWKHIYYLDHGSGRALVDVFLEARTASYSESFGNANIEALAGGLEMDTPSQHSLSTADLQETYSKNHFSIAVGGTFDHLHAGHKLLLTMTLYLITPVLNSAILHERTLTIGITGDTLLQKKQFIDELQDWDTRKTSVQNFLLGLLEIVSPSEVQKAARSTSHSDAGPRSASDEFESGLVINYVEIFDPFGPTITDKTISALVVSGESRAGGKAVNDRREFRGWQPLDVFEVDVLDAEDRNNSATAGQDNFRDKISSTEIRRRLHQDS